MDNSAQFHENFEQRFGCCICFGPKLEMVSGQCQHRICSACLYTEGWRRLCMLNCPICGLTDSFPIKKPILPQEVIDIQKLIGVQTCTKGCGSELWFWEVEAHLLSCPNVAQGQSIPVRDSTTRKTRRRVSDLGPVTVVRRSARNKLLSNSYRRRDSTSS